MATKYTSPAEIISTLTETMPKIFCRTNIESLTGGLMTYGTQKNLDSSQDGPKCFRMGKKVAYLKDDYLLWFETYLAERWQDATNA